LTNRGLSRQELEKSYCIEVKMRLIIEIKNDEELKKAESFIASLPVKSVEIAHITSQKRRNFVRWCREHKVAISEIPSREERNAR
jgi:hypothetical protein